MNGHPQVAVMCVQREMPALVRCSVCQAGEIVSTAEIDMVTQKRSKCECAVVWRGTARGVWAALHGCGTGLFAPCSCGPCVVLL